ncbi:MAG: Hsp20/alpha crystallin family protein [Methanocorpusculum sp.]|nr:Hsp20/alpha crystallin family protein [Methanocorpusculum sp.]
MTSQLPFSFETLGSQIDHFISEIGEYAANYIPEGDDVKNTIRTVIPKLPGDLPVDLAETETDFIITCDLPGVEKENVTIKLQDPATLYIKADMGNAVVRGTAAAEETAASEGPAAVFTAETYHLRERKIRSRERTLHLPSAATASGAKATFKNGIMELILPKAAPGEGVEITIE